MRELNIRIFAKDKGQICGTLEQQACLEYSSLGQDGLLCFDLQGGMSDPLPGTAGQFWLGDPSKCSQQVLQYLYKICS